MENKLKTVQEGIATIETSLTTLKENYNENVKTLKDKYDLDVKEAKAKISNLKSKQRQLENLMKKVDEVEV
jgi:hypothetical protein